MVSLMLGSEISFSEEKMGQQQQKGQKGCVNSFELGNFSQKDNRPLMEHNQRVRNQQNAQYQYAKQFEEEESYKTFHAEKEDILHWIRELSGPERFNLFVIHDQLAVMNILKMSWADFYEDQSIFSKLQPSSSTTRRQQLFDKIENLFFKRKRTKPVLNNQEASNKILAERSLLLNLRVTDTNDHMDSLCIDYDFLQNDKIDNLLGIMDLISNKAFLFRQCSFEPITDGLQHCSFPSNSSNETYLAMPFWFQDGGFQTIGNYIVAYLERNIWKHYANFKTTKNKKGKSLLISAHPVLTKKAQFEELWGSLGQEVKLKLMNDLYADFENYMDREHESSNTMKQLYVNFRVKYIAELNKNDLMTYYMKFVDNDKIIDKLLFTDFTNMKNIKCFINRLFIIALEQKIQEQFQLSCKIKQDKKKNKQKLNMQKKRQKKKENEMLKIKENSNENLNKIISSEIDQQLNFGENKYNYTLLPQEDNSEGNKCSGFIMSDQEQINMIFQDDFQQKNKEKKQEKKNNKNKQKVQNNDQDLDLCLIEQDIESQNDQELNDLLELQKLQEIKQQKSCNNKSSKNKKNKKYKIKNKENQQKQSQNSDDNQKEDQINENELIIIQKQNKEQQVQEEQIINIQNYQENQINDGDFIEVTAKQKKPFNSNQNNLTNNNNIIRNPIKNNTTYKDNSIQDSQSNNAMNAMNDMKQEINRNKNNKKKQQQQVQQQKDKEKDKIKEKTNDKDKEQNKEKEQQNNNKQSKVQTVNVVSTNNESDSFVTQDTESKKVKNKQNQWDFDIDQEINIKDIEFNKEKVLEQIYEDMINQQIEQEIQNLYDQNQLIYPLRMVVFKRLQFLIQQIFNTNVVCKQKKQKQKVDIRLFGSCVTGIQLPDSDMDISIFGFLQEVSYEQTQEVLQKLSDRLSQEPWVVKQQLILTASVPVIKLEIDPRLPYGQDKELNLSKKEGLQDSYVVKVDLTVENGKQHLGALSSNLMGQWLSLYPALFKIAMLLKAFLNARGLNDGFKGGLTSYQLLILIVSALKEHDGGLSNNYARMLIHFFDLFTNKFDSQRQGLNIYNHPSSFYPLSSEPNCQLTVIDPIRFNKNLTQNVTLIDSIFEQFRQALDQLTNQRTLVKQLIDQIMLKQSQITQETLTQLVIKSLENQTIIKTIINATQ